MRLRKHLRHKLVLAQSIGKMIPWVREKFAERRAKWLARSKRTTSTAAASKDTSEVESVSETRTAINGGENPQFVTSESTNSVPRVAHTTSTLTVTRRAQTITQKPAATPNRTRNTSRKGEASLAASSSSSCQKSVQNLVESTDHITVHIICPNARVLTFETEINKRLADLKNEVVLELIDDPENIKLFAPDIRNLIPRYRLFRAEYQGVELIEALTLTQLQILDNESLILVPRRGLVQQLGNLTREVRPPTEQEIDMATRHVPPHTTVIPLIDVNEIFQSNIQFDVRKVLISLAQTSASIIGAGPYASRLIAMLKQKLINKRNYQIDTLQCLVDMGFKREQAEAALQANNNVYSTTLEWLIQTQSEEATVDEQVSSVGIQKSTSMMSPSSINTNNETIENTAALLEIVRIYSHRDVPPTAETIESLTEMGFEELAVTTALKKTYNNKAAACEWLCGNRTGSLVELREGLSPDSPILKSILELPQVQMNLNNPKIFLAFLTILENEHTIRIWGGDNDTTSVITHILQKYHEEKHVLGLNQFYNDRL